MHIAIVRTEFAAFRGGAERYAVNLARTWRDQGHRITVVCAKHDPQDTQGMQVATVSRPKLLGPWKHRWFAGNAGEVASATGADAILCLARAYPGDLLRLSDGLHRSWLGARYPNLARRRRALLNPRHRELLKLEQQMFFPGRFQLYVANSAMIKRAVTHMYGVDPARILVIPNGVDTARFQPVAAARRGELRVLLGMPRDARIVLFSGMDFRRKGLLEAVQGFIQLVKTAPDRDRLLFACVGKGDSSFAQYALAQAGLSAQARFEPATSAIEQWYCASDVLLLPTMHDPSANAVTEALACGLPVVTSSENGARQHIVQGRNGVVLKDRTDAGAMARACRLLLDAAASQESIARMSGLMTTGDNAAAMLNALHQAVALRGQAKAAGPYVASGNQAEILRQLKRQMWASGDTRDYRQVFRQMQK